MSEYEEGMVIFYDRVTKGVLVDFRGAIYFLIGPFMNLEKATAAGEAKCRELGWQTDQKAKA